MSKLRDALEMVGVTDQGRVRVHNEDALLYDPNLGIMVLADGMGGYNAGEVASGLAVDVVHEVLQKELGANLPRRKSSRVMCTMVHDMLETAIQQANTIIYEMAGNNSLCYGMGTTLIAAIFYDNRLIVGHVGDSRLYRFRAAEFLQLSRDHSLLQDQLDAGLIEPEEARFASYRNLVTRAVGIGPDVQAEIQEFQVQVGDVYLFCSDGLTDMVEDQVIGEFLSVFYEDLPLAAQTLVDKANANGGRDNVSVALVGIRQNYAARTGWFTRLSQRFGG